MLRTYLLLVFCVVIWGSNFVFGKILLTEFSPMILSALRMGTTSVVLILYTLYLRRFVRLKWSHLKILLPLAFIGSLVNQWAFFRGLKISDPTTSALILNLTPIMTGFLAAIFLKEKLNLRMGAGALVAFLGVFFVVGNGTGLHISLGEMYMFIAMLTFSTSIILTRKLTQHIDSFATSVYSIVCGFLMIAPAAALDPTEMKISGEWWSWTLVICTAVVMQGICSLIWNRQLQFVGAAKASMFLNLQPFVAMVLGYLLLGTTVSLTQINGAVLTIGGVVLATYVSAKERSNHALVTAARDTTAG